MTHRFPAAEKLREWAATPILRPSPGRAHPDIARVVHAVDTASSKRQVMRFVRNKNIRG